MSAGQKRIAVVGAGIVGVCCAHQLARSGFAVTLYDREEPGRQASFGNSACINISSVVPLMVPGLRRVLVSMIVDPMHPLRIGLKRLPRSLPWFLTAARTLRPERVERITAARARLLSQVRGAYDRVLDAVGRHDLRNDGGLIFVYESPAALQGMNFEIDLRRRFGVASETLSGDEAREHEPALSPAVKRAIYYPQVSNIIDPYLLTSAIFNVFTAIGGRFLRQQVDAVRDSNSSVSVDAGGTSELYDDVVVAAGAWSRDLLRKMGLNVPIEAERGYHVMLSQSPNPLRIPIVSAERKVSLTPFGEEVRMTTGAEFVGLNDRPDHGRVERIFTSAAHLVEGLDPTVHSRWSGSRPSTPDSLPIIGRSRKLPNVILACGHGHQGLTFAPITGELVADLAAGRTPSTDLLPFSPDRRFDASGLSCGRGAALEVASASGSA